MSRPNPLKHPARFSEGMIERFAEIIMDAKPPSDPPWKVLDPFAGVGTIHDLQMDADVLTYGVEIEPEWANAHPRNRLGDSRFLDVSDGAYDVIVTSPTYGNRLADHHNAQDGSRRNSYTHNLRALSGDETRNLQAGNTGFYADGSGAYWDLNREVWTEMNRVLISGGMLILNTSDFIASGKVIHVTSRHIDILTDLGFTVVSEERFGTSRLRYGENSNARVDGEDITVLQRSTKAAKAAPVWWCNTCSAHTSADRHVCEDCGASRE